jgi:hypothetical protein
LLATDAEVNIRIDYTTPATLDFPGLKQLSFFAFSKENPPQSQLRRVYFFLRSRPYLERPLERLGAGGGAFSLEQQAETPSAAAAKATKVKYFTIFIRAV